MINQAVRILGHLEIEGAFCPIVVPMPTQPRGQSKKDVVQGWLAALIVVVGIGSLSLHQQKQKSVVTPIAIHQEVPVKPQLMLPTSKVLNLPMVRTEISQKQGQKKIVKLSDVAAKIERIAKRADKINAQAGSI